MKLPLDIKSLIQYNLPDLNMDLQKNPISLLKISQEKNMKIFMVACCCLLILSACNSPNKAPKYDFKTIERQFETYSDWTKDKETAMKLATNDMNESSNTNCRSAGVGWSFDKFASKGEMDCEESAEGFRCKKKGVKLDCRRINER